MKHLNQKLVSVSSNTLLSTVRFFVEQMLNMGKMNESVVAVRDKAGNTTAWILGNRAQWWHAGFTAATWRSCLPKEIKCP